ncbi:hypothetical protein K466DRAFT_591734 [Polyporus arcularius HHB13444]|uniref:MYND-type domain-containing protein n=1 Tax=Polyporus arcularius HHB13444 TaxID=1314778 RepID=A0A5C3NTD8_9APHY|nr:hypothetical protein K466DRAFT_591734 [Polyporus arcularius HHB13444]
MSSLSAVLRAPFRILSSPTFNASLYPGSGVALGRHHASWFLVYATRPIMQHKRAALCLNFVVPGDPSFVGALSSAGKPVFTIGGHADASRPVMDALLGLRDEDGCAPVALTERDQVENPYRLLADVEVLLPENELIHACAHCGKWETLHGPRFLRCSGCKSRHYCSDECQTDDWKAQYHQGECELLRDGKPYEVESRRNLHNNGWYFDYGPHGDQTLLTDSGAHAYDHALRESDVDYLAYGRRYPPHDVVPPTTPRPPRVPRNDGYPPGFVPTGDAAADKTIRGIAFLKAHGMSAALAAIPPKYPGSNAVPAHAIPAFPSLPETPGFMPTGDPYLDQELLCAYLRARGMDAEHDEVVKVVRARRESIGERERLAAAQQERTRLAVAAERRYLEKYFGVSSDQ